MRYALLLLCLGCVDASSDTEVTTVVYQFADITVGDVIPNTSLVWSAEDAREVMRRVDDIDIAVGRWTFSKGLRRYNLGKCETPRYGTVQQCYADRESKLTDVRDRYIRDLQILGVR